MSDLRPYSGVRCMCLVTGCSAGACCPHYTDHCKAHIAHQNAQPAQAGHVLSDEKLWEMWVESPSDVLRFARAIEQAVMAKRVPQWLPIETAPKDGSIFLCWVTAERYGETDEGQQYTQDVSQADFGWWRPGDDAGYFDCGCGQIADRQHISHWMHLPPPPGIGGEKGGA